MKDIIKDVVVHVIELIIGLYFALHIYNQTHPTQQYPDHSLELNRIAIEIRNNTKAIYHHEQTEVRLHDTLRADRAKWKELQQYLDERRFGHYLNN